MSFSGTLDKCKACNKTVHFIELLTADSVPYHRTCFKCSRCKGTLSISNYASMDGELYCRPHFEQLVKQTGSFTKKLLASNAKSEERKLAKTPSKVSTMFSGTLDKCAHCKKTAYPLEKVTVEGETYHQNCFKCYRGGCKLTPSSYAALDGVLYCKHHFSQLFKEKGSYSYLTKMASMKRNAAAAAAEQTAAGVEEAEGAAAAPQPTLQEQEE